MVICIKYTLIDALIKLWGDGTNTFHTFGMNVSIGFNWSSMFCSIGIYASESQVEL